MCRPADRVCWSGKSRGVEEREKLLQKILKHRHGSRRQLFVLFRESHPAIDKLEDHLLPNYHTNHITHKPWVEKNKQKSAKSSTPSSPKKSPVRLLSSSTSPKEPNPTLTCSNTDISETEYRVAIQLEVTQDDEESPEEPPTLILSVSYPEDYPDVAPRLDLSAPPNAHKHTHLDIQEDKTRLLDGLTATIEENLGMAMVFTLVTTLKDEAELLIAERQQAVQAQKDMQAAEAEAEENRKFEGTKVTIETYLEWSRRFKEEMAEEKRKAEEQREAEEKKKKGAKEEKKMTGRELWESGIATRAFVDEDDDGADILEAVKKLKVEA
jgi:hypothetical protein